MIIIKQIIIDLQMDWIIQVNEKYQTELALLKKLDKVTIYDHNSVLNTDIQNLKFSCVLNCKKLNRQYSILGKVEGDLFSHSIQISCALIDYKRIVVGRWQHQKIQLTKFAYRYNQKSAKMSTSNLTQDNNNYQIKVNPLSGQFYVCYHFLLGYDLIKDCDKFKMKITDQCQKLTSQSQKIFNTIIEVIFDQEANDPYLKSDQRVGMHFSRPVKMSKLLKKIKKLNTISSIYKIKHDLTVQNKHRSMFKKFYLKKIEKPLNNPLIIQNALIFIPKFCKKHLITLPQNAQPSKGKKFYINPFEDLEDNHEIQFAARHLQDFSKNKTGEPILQQSGLTPQQKKQLSKPGKHRINDHWFLVQQITKTQKSHEYQLLSKLTLKYDHIFQYYQIKGEQFTKLRITEYMHEKQLNLREYMHIYGKTMSLSTRLDIMTQICHVVEVLHKFHIGYFVDFSNIYVTEGNIVKIRGFGAAYSVTNWDQTKQKEKDGEKKYLMENYRDYVKVCGFVKEDNAQQKDRIQDQKEKQKSKFQSQRADIFSLGMVLYRILLDKFPFSPNCISILEHNHKRVEDFLNEIWTVETQFFLRQGGMVVKLLSHLLLKCMHMQIEKRPYVQWITVILSQVRFSLECLY